MSASNFASHARSSDGSDGASPPPYSNPQQGGMRTQYGTIRYFVPRENTPLRPGKIAIRSPWMFYVLLAGVAFLIGNATQLPINTALHELQVGIWARQERRWALKKEEHEWEVESHNAERSRMESERRTWDEERKHKEDEARSEREEHERKRLQIYWTGLAPMPACSRYKIREYTATLTNVPLGFDAMAECMSKPIHINGRDVLPSHCEDQGICGKVTGHWEVEEHYCTPYHSVIEDHGCYRPGGHQYKGKVEDIQDWTNWEGVCMTMPGPFYNGVQLGLPYYCSPAAGGKKGYWAEWMLADSNCH